MDRLWILLAVVGSVWGHGRLYDPPSRSSMWRVGFDTPKNYNDNELFCGGFQRQWVTNKGECGICGDPWDAPEPRENEDGGTYGKKVISKTFKKESEIDITVDVTANHNGWFEFRLCPMISDDHKADQKCLDQYPLEQADGKGVQYQLPSTNTGKFVTRVKLPKGLTCKRCVLQWHWTTGNRWGICEDGVTGRNGCGPQETFRGCADIAITD